MKMYEDIIAADTETMRVQQGTIHAQQDIVRSQADMIARLQQVVEAQDAWIEEHLEGCRM
ncbi:hypothetical protein K491DRAFT_603107 [Lophiostoma macrostomum CBS 122681]|uniref:Uncharacterized protein n=1 Tax=Lophiostoma macrostomum CBS 122681 TaxID=1314788 RepID=A0A6A6T1X2_9PLEO|nr:hypothetical protein K491DRAFT_603107 [Lophiostoma macrostomum CBS 122681]